MKPGFLLLPLLVNILLEVVASTQGWCRDGKRTKLVAWGLGQAGGRARAGGTVPGLFKAVSRGGVYIQAFGLLTGAASLPPVRETDHKQMHLRRGQERL